MLARRKHNASVDCVRHSERCEVLARRTSRSRSNRTCDALHHPFERPYRGTPCDGTSWNSLIMIRYFERRPRPCGSCITCRRLIKATDDPMLKATDFREAPALAAAVPRACAGALRRVHCAQDLEPVTVDATVQTKSVTFPTDAKLLHTALNGPTVWREDTGLSCGILLSRGQACDESFPLRPCQTVQAASAPLTYAAPRPDRP